MADLVCDLCDGQEFYKDGRYYYCQDCHTQSQAIRDDEHNEPEAGTGTVPIKQKATKARKKRQDVEKPEEQFTSWECYNYVLVGLVNEMIGLGAKKELKNVVKTLWYLYLRKLEVVSKDVTKPPRLQAVNNKVDAEILYGRKHKLKRKRRRSESPTSTTVGATSSMDSTVIYSERRKKARAVTMDEYMASQQTQQSDAMSIQTTSLSSIRNTPTTSTNQMDNYLHYNKSATKELRRHMSKKHLKAHRLDVNSTLTCHSTSYQNISTPYRLSADVLTRNKLYALIYLGLLIIKDKIQLGDMLRFIREGHLSYNEYLHFFPEEMADKKLNLDTYSKYKCFITHFHLREITAKLAVKLKVTNYIPTHNIIELSTRYCQELQLPEIMQEIVVGLISQVPPNMNISQKAIIIPNYEVRAMSFIIFALKLLLGLDGIAEENYSNVAQLINSSSKSEVMFDWNKWISFIQYRRTILTKEHFPTYYLTQQYDNPDLFIRFLNEHKSKYEEKVKSNWEKEVLKSVLLKLKANQDRLEPHKKFKLTLTPFKDYIQKILSSSDGAKYSQEILRFNHTKTNFDFIINPHKYKSSYFKVLDNTPHLNDDVIFTHMKNPKTDRERDLKARRKLITVEIRDEKVQNFSSDEESDDKENESNRREDEENKFIIIENKKKLFPLRHEEILKGFLKRNERMHKKNLKLFDDEDTSKIGDVYQPFERFWLQSKEIVQMNVSDFEEMFDSMPNSFKLLIEECARITEQGIKPFCEEYTLAELYLCYCAKFNTSKKEKDGIVDLELQRLVKIAVKNW